MIPVHPYHAGCGVLSPTHPLPYVYVDYLSHVHPTCPQCQSCALTWPLCEQVSLIDTQRRPRALCCAPPTPRLPRACVPRLCRYPRLVYAQCLRAECLCPPRYDLPRRHRGGWSARRIGIHRPCAGTAPHMRRVAQSKGLASYGRPFLSRLRWKPAAGAACDDRRA